MVSLTNLLARFLRHPPTAIVARLRTMPWSVSQALSRHVPGPPDRPAQGSTSRRLSRRTRSMPRLRAFDAHPRGSSQGETLREGRQTRHFGKPALL